MIVQQGMVPSGVPAVVIKRSWIFRRGLPEGFPAGNELVGSREPTLSRVLLRSLTPNTRAKRTAYSQIPSNTAAMAAIRITRPASRGNFIRARYARPTTRLTQALQADPPRTPSMSTRNRYRHDIRSPVERQQQRQHQRIDSAMLMTIAP